VVEEEGVPYTAKRWPSGSERRRTAVRRRRSSGHRRETPKTGPSNKGRRKRIGDAIRYLHHRSDNMAYGTDRERDLEVGTGQVEGSVKYVVAKRCDHGRASALKRSSSCAAST
jgi:hypothetical protein